MGLHVAQQGAALAVRHEGHQPAQRGHHLLRRDRRQQRIVQRRQLRVAVVRPQCGVVPGFLDQHVLEVLGHEQRQSAVQRQGGGLAVGGCALQQRVELGTQHGDVLQVTVVVVGGVVAHARRSGVQGGVHEAVFVRHVLLTKVQQLAQRVGHRRQFDGVLRVAAPEGEQGVGHGGAQGLVNAGVEVETGGVMGGGRQGHGADFEGVEMHEKLRVGGGAPCASVPAMQSRNAPRSALLNSA